MIEYTVDLDHSVAHVLADGLAKLSAADDAEKRVKVYEGVFSDDHELRDADGYRAALERAIDAVNALIAVSGADTTITVTVGEA